MALKQRFGWALVALVLVGILAATGALAVEPAAGVPKETKAQRDQRMAWWREARFGMFIHWGLYADPRRRVEGQEDRRHRRMDP